MNVRLNFDLKFSLEHTTPESKPEYHYSIYDFDHSADFQADLPTIARMVCYKADEMRV